MAPFESVGYWGEPTSTIDWCERNYEVSFYIAEMCNTVSNLMMIIPPLWGMAEVLKQRFEKRFIFCHFLLLLVGLGSWAFHMTLLYEMQLFDELPMVWGTCVLVYCLSEVRATATRGKFSNVPLICFLAAFSSLFTAVYLLWPQPLLQHTSYGLLVLTSFGLEIRLINFQKCRVCRKLFVMSLSTYLLGFFLWNIDKIFCPNLQLLRNVLPSPVSPLTQLHAWWHCLAGYATYLQVLFCIHSNFDFHKDKRDTRKLELTQFGCSLRWSQNSKHCQ